jgi:short-subunit dehydrogenase
MRLENRVCVITGASMGIGEAIAQRFAQEGASLAITSRDPSRAQAAAQRIGASERVIAMACDVRHRADLETLMQTAVKRFGRVDIWINNAGLGLLDSVEQMSMADLRSLFDTNFFGAVEGMQVAIAQMRKQGSGTIINISSISGHIAVPHMGAYSATKFALNAIGKAARVELLKSGIHVMTVCPGYIATDFAVNAMRGTNPQRLSAAVRRLQPARVAEAVLEGYLKRKREVVVPARDRLFIKLYQLWPELLERKMFTMLRPADEVIANAR